MIFVTSSIKKIQEEPDLMNGAAKKKYKNDQKILRKENENKNFFTSYKKRISNLSTIQEKFNGRQRKHNYIIDVNLLLSFRLKISKCCRSVKKCAKLNTKAKK